MEINVNGVTLFYEKTGSGQPLIMVHGNGEDHHIFKEAVELLKDYYTVYTPDTRDHGQSSPVKVLHYQDMADDISAMIDALNLDNVIFYGFSDGAIVGLLLAMKCRKLSKLILSGANLTVKALRGKFIRRVAISNFFKRDNKLTLMLKEPNIPVSDLAQIQVPTLVLAGEDDIVPASHTESIADAIACAELKILPGQTHTSYVIHNPEIAQLILDFCLLPCPVCGHPAFSAAGQYEICPICGWEDDPVQRRDPDLAGGANKESLNEAIRAYAEKEGSHA